MIGSGYSKGGQDEPQTIFPRKDNRHAAGSRRFIGPRDDRWPNQSSAINSSANLLSPAQTIRRSENQPGQAHEGYRRISALLRDSGRQVHHKRVKRIWRQVGFQIGFVSKRCNFILLDSDRCPGRICMAS